MITLRKISAKLAGTGCIVLLLAAPANAAAPGVVYVEPGSTLIEAARSIAPYADHEELKTWAVALYNLNPDAFIEGDIHRVRADFPLLVPNYKQRSAISSEQASKALRVPSRMRLSRSLLSLRGKIDNQISDESQTVKRHGAPPRMSPFAKRAAFETTAFKPDPVYPASQYSAEKQLEIYGGKRAIKSPRPIIEKGYPLYKEGPLGSLHTWFGEKNLASPQFLLYGDARVALAGNRLGGLSNAALSPQLNLEADLKLTATERLHASFKPLEKNKRFTQLQFNDDDNQRNNHIQTEFDLAPQTLFLEGDLAAIIAGKTNEWQSWDMPISIGLMPLLIQNGIWLNDTVLGVAATAAAQNFPEWGIANADFTAFVALDEVDTAGVAGAKKPKMVGAAFFGDMWGGYVEADWAFLYDYHGNQSYQSTGVAYSWRQNNFSSNSIRFINSYGQKASAKGSANGWLLLFESSLITAQPYTVIPYLNLFLGHGTAQAAAKNKGLLENTGLAFERDLLTASQSLSDTGHNSVGGAIGIEYLFNFDQQWVLEAAAQRGTQKNLAPSAQGLEYALAVRWQKPLSSRWIVKADAIKGWRAEGDEFSTARLELRVKF